MKILHTLRTDRGTFFRRRYHNVSVSTDTFVPINLINAFFMVRFATSVVVIITFVFKRTSQIPPPGVWYTAALLCALLTENEYNFELRWLVDPCGQNQYSSKKNTRSSQVGSILDEFRVILHQPMLDYIIAHSYGYVTLFRNV